jgi:hypothetical protein
MRFELAEVPALQRAASTEPSTSEGPCRSSATVRQTVGTRQRERVLGRATPGPLNGLEPSTLTIITFSSRGNKNGFRGVDALLMAPTIGCTV